MWFTSVRVLLAAALFALLLPAHLVAAQALVQQWQPGPEATTSDCSCDGAIDAPTSTTFPRVDKPLLVTGWVVDKTAQGWAGFDAVHVYQGKVGEGGRFLVAAGVIGKARPDVGSALGNPGWTPSGFEANVPAGMLQPGDVTLTVYAHSPSKGWWWKQVQTTLVRPRLAQPILQITNPAQGAELKSSIVTTIDGYALDPGAFDGGTGVDRLEVYIDGQRGEPQSKFLGFVDVDEPSDAAAAAYGSQFANTGWTMRFDPSLYKIGNRTLYVYARSTVTAAETLVALDLNIVR